MAHACSRFHGLTRSAPESTRDEPENSEMITTPRCKARLGEARLGKARQGKARQGKLSDGQLVRVCAR